MYVFILQSQLHHRPERESKQVFMEKITQNILRFSCSSRWPIVATSWAEPSHNIDFNKTSFRVIAVLLFILISTVSFKANAQNTIDSNNNQNAHLPVCVYIASYSPGYPWQNGITRSIKKTLNGHCHLKTFYMNTKKVSNKKTLNNIGLQAIAFIASNKPDVVIVSDDNAVKYVLQNHYKNSSIPFVFCGVNNTGIHYGLPYKNTTGMIEKNPIEVILKLLFSINPAKTRVAMLTTQGTSADFDNIEFTKIAKEMGIKTKVYQLKNEREWRKVFKQIQLGDEFDLIYLSNRAAFKTWDHKKNYEWALKYNSKITFSTQDWMMPYSAIGITKIPDEQGTWAAKAAIEILNGLAPSEIAVIPNQNFQLWTNKQITKPFADQLPENIFSQSIVYDEKVPQ